MLNFAEQTGSGAVMLVWSFPQNGPKLGYTKNAINTHIQIHPEATAATQLTE